MANEPIKAARYVSIPEAVALLHASAVVALPTETVYGLGANALDPRAVARIFEIKRRPRHHPLIVHLADADHMLGYAEVTPAAWSLAERFWPGPLTLILPRGPLALPMVTGELPTVGLRVPAHPATHAVLTALGAGIAAPSANRFGHISPTTAQHVAADLGAEVDGILDGGPCDVGIESTIVDLSGETPAVLRLGAISPESIAETLGREVSLRTHAEGGRATAPGQLSSHYAPRADLELWPRDEIDARARSLSNRKVAVLTDADLGTTSQSWAKNLYAALRAADAGKPDLILIPTPPPGALTRAIHDRLGRASAPRTESMMEHPVIGPSRSKAR